jgi:predicted nucleic acid-binding protein
MSEYLFDTSSIVALAIKHRIDFLVGNHTLELAGYEIGNYLWKEIHLTKSLSHDELPTLERIFLKIFENMNVLRAWPPSAEVVKLAGELGLTYYDAIYLHQAKKLGLTLITEDSKLKEKAEKVVDVRSANDISR